MTRLPTPKQGTPQSSDRSGHISTMLAQILNLPLFAFSAKGDQLSTVPCFTRPLLARKVQVKIYILIMSSILCSHYISQGKLHTFDCQDHVWFVKNF